MLEALRKKLSLASADLSEGLSKLSQRKSPSLPKFPTGLSEAGTLRGSATVVGLASAVLGPSTSAQSSTYLNPNAGEEILHHYQELCSETRELSEGNVAAADRCSGSLSRLCSLASAKTRATSELYSQLSALPSLGAALEELGKETERLGELCRGLDAALAYLEVLKETEEVQERRLDARFRLAMLREEKVAGLAEAKAEISASFAEALEERRRSRQAAAAEKSSLYSEAFAHDLALYKATGLIANSLAPLAPGFSPEAVEVKALSLDGNHPSRPSQFLREGQVHGLDRLSEPLHPASANGGETDATPWEADPGALQDFLRDVKMEDSGIAGSDSQSVEGET